MFRHRFPVTKPPRIFSIFVFAMSLAGLYAVRLQFAQEVAPTAQSPLQALSSQPLPVERYLHTATLLPNGKVLIVGGTSTGAAEGALQSALLYDPFRTDWTTVATPLTARYGHIAVLLRSGKVLVAGGGNAGGLLRSAEIYDPATNRWTQTGAMSANRFRATATLLSSASNAGPAGASNPRNGAALVIGGEGVAGALETAEYYNPSTGVWQLTGASMKARRAGHTATQLISGDVLVAGGYSTASQPLAGAEIYDLFADRWRSVGNLRAGRFGHTATLLTTGQVMAVGGLNGAGAALDSSEIYDPIKQTWTSVTSKLAQARAYHSATLLPNGSLFVIGGFRSASGAGVRTAESYDPTSANAQQWAPAGNFENDRGAHTSTLLASARVLIVGGAADGGATMPLSSVEIHDPAVGRWKRDADMKRARLEHTATLLSNGKVLVAGGRDASGSIRSAELYTPGAGGDLGEWRATADLNVARKGHTATLLANGKALVAGGNGGGQFLNSAEVYDPLTGAWTLTNNTMANAREDHTATLLPNGKVLITGGRNSLGILRACELYDPATNSWTSVAPLLQFRANHTATQLYDGRVLAAGGLPELASSELYDFTTNRWTNVVSQMLPSGHQQHTATLLPNGKVLLVSGLQGAGNASTHYSGSAHLFDPSRLQWDSVTAPAGRVKAAATLLPNGKALIVGGFTAQSGVQFTTVIGNSVQIYDPARGTSVPFTNAPTLNTPRDGHTATLLLNGKVLIAGGQRQSAINGAPFIELLSSAETFDDGLGIDEQATAVSPFVTSATWNGPGNPLCAAGGRFQGVSESASGGSTSSNTNYPVLQLMRLDNGQQYYLSPDPDSKLCATRGWANNGYGSLTVPATTSPGTINNMHPGPVMLTVFVNGIPGSRSLILGVSGGQSADSPTVNLSGRIHTVADSGLPATIELRGSDGSQRIVRSGPNGEYTFENVPTITPNTSVSAVTPSQILVGSQNTQITVTGSGFRPIGATIPNQILFNGQPLATIFDSPTQLRATIPSQFLQTAGFASVAVRILNSDGSTSVTPPLPIEITASSESARPEIKSLNPSSAPAGATGLQVIINGLNLLNGTTQVLWNGQSRAIVSGSASNTQLVFSPLTSDLAQPGAARVQVVNAGGASNEVTFTITQSGPTITSLSPSSYTAPVVLAGPVPTLTLTVNGSGFQSNSVVRANGTNLITSFVSANQLRAQLSSAFLNTQSNVVINVLNSSGNTLSNSVNFPINQTPAATTGSVLLFPFYSTFSSETGGSDSTTLSITNTNSAQGVRVYLFFVNGADRAVRSDLRFLNPNQTLSFSASQFFPFSRGYVVAVAYGTNCPTSFNFLRGSASISLASGHGAALDAIAIRALSNPGNCFPPSIGTVFIPGRAILNFNGSIYERVPHQVIADNIPSIRDGNNTILALNALGGDLRTNNGPSNLGLLNGILYDTDLSAYGFFAGFVTGNTPAQIFSTLGATFPGTTPSFTNIISVGERGKMTLYPSSSEGTPIFGAVLNRGPALNGGYLLRPLTTKSASLIVPYFEPPIGFTPQGERNSTGGATSDATVEITGAGTGERASEENRSRAARPTRQQQQPSPGAPITYTITPSAAIPSGEQIEFQPPSRTVTPAGGGSGNLAPQELAAPLDNDNNNFCGRTSPGLSISGTISGLNGSAAMVTHRLMNNKAPDCNLPDEVPVNTSSMGDFRADNVMVKQIGLEGVYMIKPSHNNYDFKFNPIDPTDPNKDQPEVTAPPLVGQSIGWDFIAEPKAACPNITAHPSSQAVCAGAPVTFTVSASGTTPLTYQWRKNGSPITGQTNASFTINSASSADSGSYDVVVTGACGSATSQPATLTVNSFSLDKTSDSFPSSGGAGSINVSATVDTCAWTATKESGATWITLGASGGVGDGSLGYTVAQNSGANSRSAMLTVAGIAFTVTQSGTAPSATLSALSPNIAPIGTTTLTVTISGTNFSSGAKARWQGGERVTGFVNATQLTVTLTPADLAVAGAFNIDVVNPSPAVPSNALVFTVTQTYEADVAPRPPGGNGSVTIADWAQVGRYVAGLDAPGSTGEYQRADCAPLATRGDGRLTVADWVLAGLYASGNIPLNPPGGPTAPASSFQPVTFWSLLQSFLLGDPRFPIRPEKVSQAAAEPRALRLTTNRLGPEREVVIDIDAQGDEQALGFSLSFDPKRWRAIIGSDSPAGERETLIVNANQAQEGRVGIIFMTPKGETLAAGRRHITTIRFAPVSDFAESEIADDLGFISFADEPVEREIVGVGASDIPLPVAYWINDDQSPEILFAAMVRLGAKGRRSWETVSRYDSSVNLIAFNPIVPGPTDDQVFLVLFGRGIQPRDDYEASVRIGGLNAPIQFRGQIASESEGFAGLDRIVVPIPREMAGRGVVDVEMTVGRKTANKFQVSFK